MSHVVCLMNVDADRVTFTWSEGPAYFEPYELGGMVYKDFREIAAEARARLADLVKDYLFDEQGMGKSAFALAEAGHELYLAMFQPSAEQARQAKQVRKWLEELAQQLEVDTLEIVVESPWSLPWNVVYDQQPDKAAFLSGDESTDRWKPFWGLRYNLAGGRKVDPLRRMPLLEEPKVLMVVDPEIRDGLPVGQQERLAEFVETHSFTMVHSKEALQEAIGAERPDLLYWLSHAEPDALVLAGEPISPRNMRKLLRQDDDAHFGGLAFLNACQTAEGGATGSFFEAFHSVGFAGMIGTEHQTVDQFANPLGLDFLEAFLDRGEPVGSALRKLRGRVPLGLLYGTYCPPEIRVNIGNVRDSLEISQVHTAGIALSAALAADPIATRALPPLPHEPYRSLAYYDREDRALFAGRDDDIERFATYLDDASTRILVLHGESGVGKSSFLHAGVIPYLEDDCLGYRFIRDRATDASAGMHGSVIFIRATNDLFGQLAQALCEFCARPYEYQTPLGEKVIADLPGALGELIGDDVNQAIVRSVLRSDPAIMGRIMAAISDRLPFTAILVIDQGEEVFTLAQTPEDQQRGRQALDMLRRTVGAAGNFKVIFALRTEHFGRVIDRLRRGLHDTGGIREYLLTDFDEDNLLEAIRRPTDDKMIQHTSDVPFEKYGFRYAEGVAKEIAHRVVRYTTQRRDSVLPLMQVICTQLYRLASQRAGKTITLADLDALGGIQGGMRSHVEGLLGELLKGRPLEKRSVQKLFTQLYLKQPDGTLTTALLAEDEVRKRWTGRLPFDELLRASLAMRLLKVNTLRIGFEEERRYISLGHDALAKLAAQWDEELARSERVRRVVKRIAAWATAAVLLVVVIGSFVAWMRHINARSQAVELVKRIKSATPAELPNIIKHELPAHRRWADAQLRKIAAGKTSEPAHQLRASLALMPIDDTQTAWLSERLLDCRSDEFPIIRDSLKPPSDELREDLWQKLHDQKLAIKMRFYAGMALASYASDADWSPNDLSFLVKQLIASNIDNQRDFRSYLAPIKPKLLNSLRLVFQESTARDGARVSAANALAEFAADQPELLADAACMATPEQYEIIYDQLKLATQDHSEVISKTLRKAIRVPPSAALFDGGQMQVLVNVLHSSPFPLDTYLLEGEREQAQVRLGRHRAGAAITLIRLKNYKAALDAFSKKDDPEAVTQFVHGCKARGVTAAELIACLETAAPHKNNVIQRYGILLALGEYDWKEVYANDSAMAKKLAQSYQTDSSSTIHSATGWLLRNWKAMARDLDDAESQALDKAVTELDKVDQQPLEYHPDREWFVKKVTSESPEILGWPGGQQQPDYFTFIVFKPEKFLMGSPADEVYRDSDQTQHEVTLTKPFAICDREVTRGEYRHYSAIGPAGGDKNRPIKYPSSFEIVSYCRWLTIQAGMEDAQFYLDPMKVTKGKDDKWPKEFIPDRTGFRMPTEAEWERACRADTQTRYSFGSSTQWLDAYAWFADDPKSDFQPVAQKRPNLRGLFDMHGSALEWCHDFYGDYTAGPDPTGPCREDTAKPTDPSRVLRGGGAGSISRSLSSAHRFFNSSKTNWFAAGFRLCMYLPPADAP